MAKTLVICLSILLFATTTAAAQKSRRSSSTASARATAIKEQRLGAERIVAEARILSTFLYRYGGIVKDITSAEKTAADNGSPAALVAQIQKNKAAVAATVRNLTVGMKELETYLALGPSTKTYFDQVNGLSDDIGLAADTADAGKLDEAGQKLLVVLDNLTSALLPPAGAN